MYPPVTKTISEMYDGKQEEFRNTGYLGIPEFLTKDSFFKRHDLMEGTFEILENRKLHTEFREVRINPNLVNIEWVCPDLLVELYQKGIPFIYEYCVDDNYSTYCRYLPTSTLNEIELYTSQDKVRKRKPKLDLPVLNPILAHLEATYTLVKSLINMPKVNHDYTLTEPIEPSNPNYNSIYFNSHARF